MLRNILGKYITWYIFWSKSAARHALSYDGTRRLQHRPDTKKATQAEEAACRATWCVSEQQCVVGRSCRGHAPRALSI